MNENTVVDLLMKKMSIKIIVTGLRIDTFEVRNICDVTNSKS